MLHGVISLIDAIDVVPKLALEMALTSWSNSNIHTESLRLDRHGTVN